MTHAGVDTLQAPSIAAHPTRREHDSLGDWAVPSRAYYGVHTARALENFPISGHRISRPTATSWSRWPR